MNLFHGLITILSNFIAIPIALKWYAWGHFIVPLLFLGDFLISSGYHSCDSWIGMCLFGNYQLLHDFDFWFAQMTVSTSLIHLIYWVSPSPYIAIPVGIPGLQTAFIFFFGLINAVVINLTSSSTVGQLLTTGAAVLTIVFYWIVYTIIHKHFPRYNYRHMVVGLSFTGTALLLFNLQNQVPELYWLIHSMWHAMGLCGSWYWASVMPIFPAWLQVGVDVNAISTLVSSPINVDEIWERNLSDIKSTDLEAQSPKNKFVKKIMQVNSIGEKKGN